MNLSDSLCCIYYNSISIFFITLNMLLPFYDEDILQIQYKIIEMIDENIVFANSCRKRKRFNIFVENIIEKNKDFLENIKKQEDEVNDINNYEEIIDDNIGLYDSNDSSNSSDSNDDCEQEYDETIFEKKDN
jgi:hypothetical protein